METKIIEEHPKHPDFEIEKMEGKQKPSLSIKLRYEVLAFIFQTTPREAVLKVDKAEAFYSLVKRQYYAMLTREDEYLVGSVNSLAQDWGWTREKVKAFLDDLVQRGAITLTKKKNKFLICMNGISTDMDEP
ncbi:MAG: hypothetical protein IJP82_01625 [Bacteroidaceae bacterium]|nr:hypothetical protein [Bacteroidaceae bacterium]